MGAFAKLTNNPGAVNDPRILPVRDYKLAKRNPFFRERLRETSICEDDENSFYTGILDTAAEHCLGTVPMIMGHHTSPEANDSVEDRFRQWAINNSIGSALRMIRRGAMRTGIGIGIPYRKEGARDQVKLAIKTICSTHLKTPIDAAWEDRIRDGIEYDKYGDPVKIYLQSEDPYKPQEYAIKDIIFWYKNTSEETHIGTPECGPAFCLFPSIRRFMDAVVKAEEFKACIPMAVELDAQVYAQGTESLPTGSFEHEPGMVPTLPPGAKLTGLNVSPQGAERVQYIQLVMTAAARCIQMPKNIALGDSSGHNMATAAIDIQPWVSAVKTDRIDFEPVVRQVFDLWYNRAVLISDYLDYRARSKFTYNIQYDVTFEHPDPNKRANARAVDLASGATTLHKVYTDQCLNPRREMDREAQMLGITRQQYNELIMANRVAGASQQLLPSFGGPEVNDDQK